jgi:hypothetical protein
MALRLVQEGKGDPRPLVLGFLLGSDQDMYLPITIGERACLILDDSATGPAMPQLLEFAYKQANLRSVSDWIFGRMSTCSRIAIGGRERVGIHPCRRYACVDAAAAMADRLAA